MTNDPSPHSNEMLTNKILSSLPAEEFGRLLPLLEPQALPAGQRLAGAGQAEGFVYFPEGAVLSYHLELGGGHLPEIGMVGAEGAACLGTLLGPGAAPGPLEVLAEGSALRLPAADFERALARSEALRRAVFAYAGLYVRQVAQRAACTLLHHTRQRLAVWLLLLSERVGADAVELTQGRAARHLGLRRAGVAVILGELERLGAVRYEPGRLRVTDRRALEAVACECYAATAQH